MGPVDDDMTTRTATDAATVREPADEAGDADDLPVEPMVDVDERLAEEAGYGYGV